MFNSKQLEAITCRDRFIFVNAGAGSGKTTVMIERIKTLIKEGIIPNEILGLTFSREAAIQMKRRLNIEDVFIATFHSFCFEHIKNKKLIENDQLFHPDLLLKISLYKNKLRSKPLGFKKYQAYLETHELIDYDDMLIEFLKLKKIPQFKHILVDEFQDTNFLQLQILMKLMSKRSNVFVVGDPDQSIYRFRGAMPSVIHQYIQQFHATVLTLDANYRSDKNILSIANRLIIHNKNRIEKTLKNYSNKKGHVEILLLDRDKYSLTIINLIKTSKYKSFGIFARTNQKLYDIKIDMHHQMPIFLKNKTQLLTLHESKGLEFDVVFIIGIDNKTLPHYLSKTKEHIEEERRLFYVGITRAKHQLYFIQDIDIKQERKNVKLSKFMFEISQNQQFKAIK